MVELVDALGHQERVVIGQGHDARSEPDPSRALGGRGDEDLGRGDDLHPTRMVLADPDLVEAEPVEMRDQREIPVEGEGGVLVDRMERREERAEPNTPPLHPASQTPPRRTNASSPPASRQFIVSARPLAP